MVIRPILHGTGAARSYCSCALMSCFKHAISSSPLFLLPVLAISWLLTVHLFTQYKPHTTAQRLEIICGFNSILYCIFCQYFRYSNVYVWISVKEKYSKQTGDYLFPSVVLLPCWGTILFCGWSWATNYYKYNFLLFFIRKPTNCGSLPFIIALKQVRPVWCLYTPSCDITVLA